MAMESVSLVVTMWTEGDCVIQYGRLTHEMYWVIGNLGVRRLSQRPDIRRQVVRRRLKGQQRPQMLSIGCPRGKA